jgi:hypothetical protein
MSMKVYENDIYIRTEFNILEEQDQETGPYPTAVATILLNQEHMVMKRIYTRKENPRNH